MDAALQAFNAQQSIGVGADGKTAIYGYTPQGQEIYKSGTNYAAASPIAGSGVVLYGRSLPTGYLTSKPAPVTLPSNYSSNPAGSLSDTSTTSTTPAPTTYPTKYNGYSVYTDASGGSYYYGPNGTKVPITGTAQAPIPAAPVGLDTTYQMKPGETVAQYNARIQAYNASKGDYQPAGRTDLTSFAPLSSSNLAGGASSNYQTSGGLPNSYGGLVVNGQAQETPEQKQADSMYKSLQDLMTQESGKTGFTNEQNAAQGIDVKKQLVTDLSNKVQQSQAAAVNIRAAPQTGEGVTTAIDQRQRAEQLRLNTIQTMEYGAQLQAAQGNLSTAQDLVTRAVNAKYDPIEAQITAAQNNLKLFMDSPAYTTAEKNQAMATQKYLQDQADAVDAQKQMHLDIQKIAINAAANSQNFSQGNTPYATMSQALDAMSKATDPIQAEQIAASVGLTGSTSAPRIIGSATSGYYTVDSNGKVTLLKSGSGSGTNDKLKTVDYGNASQFVSDNPGASYDELFNTILQNTNLTSTEANAFLASKGIKKPAANDLAAQIEAAFGGSKSAPAPTGIDWSAYQNVTNK